METHVTRRFKIALTVWITIIVTIGALVMMIGYQRELDIQRGRPEPVWVTSSPQPAKR
jgi:hypothetical protein